MQSFLTKVKKHVNSENTKCSEVIPLLVRNLQEYVENNIKNAKYEFKVND